MATPTEPLDPPAVMSYGGLVDASTAEGQADEAADWAGAIAAMPIARSDESRTEAQHLADITRRRGAYAPVR